MPVQVSSYVCLYAPAIAYAMKRFPMCLHVIHSKIITDCNALVLAMKRVNIPSKIARWTLTVQNYNFIVVRRPFDRMQHMDALSRRVMMIEVIRFEDQLQQ